MRALVLTHVFPRAEDDPSAPFLLTWANALQAAGHELRVVAPHDSGLPSRRVVGGVPVRFVRYAPERWEVLAYRGEMHRIALRPWGPPVLAAFVIATARALRQQAVRFRPDVLHVHWWMPGAVIARLAGLRVPTVVQLHGTDVGVVESRPGLASLARWALAGADRIEVVSTDLGERLERATGLRADAVNPMPLHPSRLQPLAPGERAARDGAAVLLGVGRLIPEKGFGDLVAAAARLEHAVRVVLVGEGPQEGPLRSQARAAGVELELRGRVDPADLRSVYAEAAVVVQCSHREGFGLVAAEAAALGVPVVATDSGGARDVLPHDALVRARSPAALARAIARAVDAREDPAPAAGVRDHLGPTAARRRTEEGWTAAVDVRLTDPS